MSQFRITAPDGTVYNVNGPEGATEQDALAQVQAQHSAAPTVPETSQTLGFEQGLNTVGDNLALGAKKLANSGILPFLPSGAGDMIEKGGQAIGLPSTEQAVQSHADAANPAKNGNVQPGKLGRFGGEVLGTLPAMAVGGPFVGGAAAGAMTADPNAGAAEHIADAGIGGTVGKLFSGLGAIIAPHASDAVTRLAQAGVRMTPGQIFGGITKGLEDRAAGFPIADWFINGAKRNSLRDFGTAAGNEALQPIGSNVIPRGVSGQDMSTAAHDAFDNNYGQILPQISVQLGPTAANAVTNAGDRVAARLPDTYDDQFQGTLADVFKKMAAGQTQPSNTFPGQAVHDAMSDLGYSSRGFQGQPHPNDQEMGRAFGTVREGLRSSIASSDPWAAGPLQQTDAAYRGFIPVDKAIRSATGNGSGLEAGVFSPQQLRRAVLSGDRSVRGTAASQGNVPLQQLAEDGIQVLPSSVADSGSAGRVALPAMLAEAAANPAAAAKAAMFSAAIPAVYSRPGIAATNAIFARQAGPGATALGNMVSGLAAPVGGTAFNAAKGPKRK